MTDQRHRPRYVYCGYPETCCGHVEAVAVECAACLKAWPCETKRSHLTPGQLARVARWAEGRGGRPPCTCAHHRRRHDRKACAVKGCTCRASWLPDPWKPRTPDPLRRAKCSDIDADHVVELARAWLLDGPPVVAALVAEGFPEKVALRKVERLVDRGRLSFGTSAYYAWPVEAAADRQDQMPQWLRAKPLDEVWPPGVSAAEFVERTAHRMLGTGGARKPRADDGAQ